MKACENCQHYISVNEKEGVCRRYPPQAAAPNYFQFAGVRPDMWCGEFSEKKPKKGK